MILWGAAIRSLYLILLFSSCVQTRLVNEVVGDREVFTKELNQYFDAS
jgi:hypothetical protein